MLLNISTSSGTAFSWVCYKKQAPAWVLSFQSHLLGFCRLLESLGRRRSTGDPVLSLTVGVGLLKPVFAAFFGTVWFGQGPYSPSIYINQTTQSEARLK